MYELLKDNPHDNILPVYGICANVPSTVTPSGVRLVMKFCAHGGLSDHLRTKAKAEVRAI
jgi:hypothetical protein